MSLLLLIRPNLVTLVIAETLNAALSCKLGLHDRPVQFPVLESAKQFGVRRRWQIQSQPFTTALQTRNLT